LARFSVVPEHPMSEPFPWKPLPPAAGAVREQPEETRFENDFADLAARFSAHGGGGLSPELSADLALEIVLNEIVEQACLATGATGAAIVLERDGEMVCRASSGATAPELGSRLETSAGLSGECFKTRKTQWCDDAASDPRVDAGASERLGVRSIVVMPLLRGEHLAGVIELFSSQPYAFGIRDERTLEVLADRTLNNLDHATKPLEVERLKLESPAGPNPEEQSSMVQNPELRDQALKSLLAQAEGPPPEVAPADLPLESPPLDILPLAIHAEREPPIQTAWPEVYRRGVATGEAEAAPAPRSRWVGWMSWAAALAVAILLGALVGWQFRSRQTSSLVRTAPASTAGTASAASPASTTAPGVNPSSNSTDAGAPVSAPAKPTGAVVPPGGLLVLDNGKEVFRMPPASKPVVNPDQQGGMERASSREPDSVMELSAAAAEGSLLERVEPEYPDAARQQNVQGAVVLEVHIAADGSVQDIQVISGPPLLAQASSDAVKHWKFKPRAVNGHPVEMQTKITLNFRLPQ
jgi:TonB family protein